MAAADDPAAAAVAGPRSGDRVFTVVAARPSRQQAFPIAEHRPVLRISERPASVDRPMDRLRVRRQLADPDRRLRRGRLAGRYLGAGEQTGCDADSEPPPAQRVSPRRPTGEQHGLSLKAKDVNVTESGLKAQASASIQCTEKGRRACTHTHANAFRFVRRCLKKHQLRPARRSGPSHRPERRDATARARRPLGASASGPSPGQRAALASATVSAVMLTMRRTVAEGVRMCTGCAAPSSTGPIAMPPPAATFSRL